MISELLAIVVQIVTLLWPIKIVREWERGGRLVCGHWVSEKGPGWYWNVPFFMDMLEVSIAEAICGTPRQDVTLSDDTLLSFSATCTARVVDVKLAICSVDDYRTTTQELLASVLADKLAEVDAARLTPEKRGRLFADLKRWVAEEAKGYGVEVSKVRFTSFVTHAKAHRLIIDQAMPAAW
jgi:regulator of protease activity HflC (stomatin/prohibitin superfamily)